MVLVVLPNELEISRIGVAAGRSLANAVRRNRAKRRLREALRPHLPQIQPGWDAVLLGRRPLADAPFSSIQEAVSSLLQRARLLKEPHGE
jgi:ribonuclease P protein component